MYFYEKKMVAIPRKKERKKERKKGKIKIYFPRC